WHSEPASRGDYRPRRRGAVGTRQHLSDIASDCRGPGCNGPYVASGDRHVATRTRTRSAERSGLIARFQHQLTFRGVKAMTDLHELSTSHGSIVVEEAGDGGLPVLLIHGNSLSREVFRKQLDGALSRKHRLVAFDLPGHGQSGDALDASRTYTRPGLASAVIEMLSLLGISEVAVVGWSLGGHIALEMASKYFGIKGLFISGAPPVSRYNMAEGFIPTSHMRL